MVFLRYHNNPEATQSSFVEGGWYRTGDVGIMEDGSSRLGCRIKETISVHGVSYGIPEFETDLQAAEGVTHSFLATAPLTANGRCHYLLEDASTRLSATHRALRDTCIKMIMLPPQLIIPIPLDQMEKTTLGKLSRSRLLARFKQGELAKHVERAEEL